MTASPVRRALAFAIFTIALVVAVIFGVRSWVRGDPDEPGDEAPPRHGREDLGEGRDAASAGSGDAAASEILVEEGKRYVVRRWSFALDRYALTIEDVGMTRAPDRVLGRKPEAELAVNAGFFDPSGDPVGLAISEGTILSKLAPRLSGGVMTVTNGHATLTASEDFVMPGSAAPRDAMPADELAIQCRPRLVVDGKANVKADDGARAERTALCAHDGGGVLDVVIVRGSEDGASLGPSLFALARYLAPHCESALNLDGGPSTTVAWREAGEVRLLGPRGPVRHAITFSPRSAKAPGSAR